MSEAVKHTPTPWKQLPHSEFVFSSHGNICAASNPKASTVVGYFRPDVGDNGGLSEAVANAAFIVRAVNAHNDLVAALKKARGKLHKAIIASGSSEEAADACCEEYDATLAKAEPA